jgi:acetamidase/formamidase
MQELKPVLTVNPGDRIRTTTLDAHGLDDSLRKVAEKDNPLTGPFAVRDAEPGDMLVVHLEDLAPNRELGWSIATLAPGVVEPGYVTELPSKTYAEWAVDFESDALRYLRFLQKPEDATTDDAKSFSTDHALQLPLKPMLGCLGVAPPLGQAILATTAGPWGGNMDYPGFGAGVTVYFPVFAGGALLFVGDGHAAQSEGEIAGSGIEISMDLTFSVDLVKRSAIEWPRGEDDRGIFTVGNARPLVQAVQHATTEMMRWLQQGYGLDRERACILMGQGAEYDLGNVFDPAYTMVCRMRKELLSAPG